MPKAVFEPAITASERSKTVRASDCSATAICAKFIRLTKLTLTNNCAPVKLRNVLSRQSDIREGVRQSDPLACLLFNISLENIIRDAEVETRGTIISKSVQMLAYAVDIVIIGRSLAVVKETFISMEKAAKEMGLTVNENKN
jgi:hypothetical protein